MDNNLRAKIRQALTTEKKSDIIRLNTIELTTLVNMQRVTVFKYSNGMQRFAKIEGNEYYDGIGSLDISRTQAKQLAYDFERFSKKDGQDLYAQVYISDWRKNKLYISL